MRDSFILFIGWLQVTMFYSPLLTALVCFASALALIGILVGALVAMERLSGGLP